MRGQCGGEGLATGWGALGDGGGGTRTRPPARSPETHPDGPKLCACVFLHRFSGD